MEKIDWYSVEKKILERLTKDSNDPEKWKDLITRIALSLNCLPSYFPDGNEHIIEAIDKLKSEASRKVKD